MVSEGQFVGLDWNRIARLHSQVLVSTCENSLTALPSESHYFTRLVIVNFRRLDHPSPFEKATYLEMEL